MKQVVYSALLLLVCFVCGCDKIQKGIREAAVFVLAAPDYNESKMWYVERNDQGDGVDVFILLIIDILPLIRGRHSMKIPLRADIWMCLQRCKSCFPPFPHKL